jgi:hypothetical protein
MGIIVIHSLENEKWWNGRKERKRKSLTRNNFLHGYRMKRKAGGEELICG